MENTADHGLAVFGAQYSRQSNTAVLTNLVVQLELAKITLRKETPLIQILDKPIFPLERIKIGKAKSAVIGGFVFGFLTIIILISQSLYKKMML